MAATGSDKPDRAELGRRAENRALAHLQAQGLRLVARNYRCRLGEIDLIMHHDSSLVFVEVRLRSHPGYGSAEDSLTRRKQQRISLAARHYLMHHPDDAPCRFDLVAFNGNLEAPHWIQGAFVPDD